MTVELGVLDAEIDLTMVDRVVALLQPGPLYKMNNTKHTNINNMYASLATGHSAVGFLLRICCFLVVFYIMSIHFVSHSI